YLDESKSGRYKIYFGDNILGKKPTPGSVVTVTYIVTNGKDGNGATNFTFSGVLKDNNLKSITSGISLLRTQQQSSNGDNIEEIDSIKYLAPRVYASQFRAVTANDYKGLVPYIYSNVESINAYGGEELDPPEYGKVYLSIKPRNGTFLSEITKSEILRNLKQYSIAGVQPVIIDLKYLYIELDSTIYYNKNQTSDAEFIRSKIINTLNVYANSVDLNSFGGRFKYSKINALIDNTDQAITSNITKVRMRLDISPEFNSFATYKICFGNAVHIKKGGYSIKSSGFYIDGVTSVIYIGDVQTSDNTGKLFFFKIENNVPVIVKNNAGFINYSTGDLLLEVVNITGVTLNNGFIEIQAIPESNDIVGLKELYLQIDIRNSVVNMIEDIITSGENTSATLFTSTSSYLNGNYTR
ncbi:MAG: baseplate wedge protein, partial [Candidatus Fonsibacter ubiquis]